MEKDRNYCINCEHYNENYRCYNHPKKTTFSYVFGKEVPSDGSNEYYELCKNINILGYCEEFTPYKETDEIKEVNYSWLNEDWYSFSKNKEGN